MDLNTFYFLTTTLVLILEHQGNTGFPILLDVLTGLLYIQALWLMWGTVTWSVFHILWQDRSSIVLLWLYVMLRLLWPSVLPWPGFEMAVLRNVLIDLCCTYLLPFYILWESNGCQHLVTLCVNYASNPFTLWILQIHRLFLTLSKAAGYVASSKLPGSSISFAL